MCCLLSFLVCVCVCVCVTFSLLLSFYLLLSLTPLHTHLIFSFSLSLSLSQVMVMGSPGSGKSTMINAIMNEPLVASKQPSSVRGVSIRHLPGSAVYPELQLWDFPGVCVRERLIFAYWFFSFFLL